MRSIRYAYWSATLFNGTSSICFRPHCTREEGGGESRPPVFSSDFVSKTELCGHHFVSGGRQHDRKLANMDDVDDTYSSLFFFFLPWSCVRNPKSPFFSFRAWPMSFFHRLKRTLFSHVRALLGEV